MSESGLGDKEMAEGAEVSAEEAEGGDPPADGEEPDVEVRVEELCKELELINDRHLRLAAEFDNYRRRSQVQFVESGMRAQASLVGTLLDALDDLGRVTSIDPEVATVESVLEGVGLVERKLSQLLQDAGLEELDPEGEPFDPNVMEAMVRVPAESEGDDDMVDQVLQKGFRFGGHLVRPARVSVRKFQ